MTLYVLVTELLNETMSIKKALLDQNRLITEINYLLTLLKNENEKFIIRKEKKNRTFTVEKRFLNKAKNCLIKEK